MRAEGSQSGMELMKPTTEARGSMEKFEAEAKKYRRFFRPLAWTLHCQQTLINLIP